MQLVQSRSTKTQRIIMHFWLEMARAASSLRAVP